MQVQAKGQVTIDQRVREEMGIRPGDEVVWVKNREGRWELWKADDLESAFDEAMEGFAEFSRRSRKGYAPRRT
jgi:AbrB family looped-hinge helix DNA binding protein